MFYRCLLDTASDLSDAKEMLADGVRFVNVEDVFHGFKA